MSKFKKNTWYKNLTHEGSFFLSSNNSDEPRGKGINFIGSLFDSKNSSWGKFDSYRLATQEEINIVSKYFTNVPNTNPQMSYSAYLLNELLLLKDEDFKNLPYDEKFAKTLQLYDEFENSKFNTDDKSEYDCITDFVIHYKSIIRAKNFSIDLEAKTIFIEGKNHKIAPKRCSYTKRLMFVGFSYVDDYVADTDKAKELVVEDSNYNSWENLILSHSVEDVYYTKWQIEDEFYTDNGYYFQLNSDNQWEGVKLD